MHTCHQSPWVLHNQQFQRLIVVFEVKFAKRPGVLAGGKTRAPAATPSILACILLAVGRKSVAAILTDFTLVWEMVLLVMLEFGWEL